MKPPAAPWLLGLLAIVAMVPRNSNCVELLHAPHSPLSSSHARHDRTAFLHPRRSRDPTTPCVTDPRHNCKGTHFTPPAKTTTASSARSVPAPLAASSSSSVPPSSRRTAPSPWSPGRWKMTLDFGHEEADASERRDLLGEGWGSSGGRLVLSFDVVANADAPSAREDASSVQRVWLGGNPTGTIEPQTDGEAGHCASYVDAQGIQHVDIAAGPWRIAPPLPLPPSHATVVPGQASTLRCSATLRTAVARGTIRFPPEQRLLLRSNAYRAPQYARGARTLLPHRRARDRAQERLEGRLNHETGDRRLDGRDLLATLGGYKDAADAVAERDRRRRRWKELANVLPTLDSSVDTGQRAETNKLLEQEKRWGIWPGDTELLTLERGVILAAVAGRRTRRPGLFSWMQPSGGSTESVVVGKWSAVPVFEEGLR